MEGNKVGFISIDEYIATFPEEIQIILEELRATIKAWIGMQPAGYDLGEVV
jgi:hypothetical protein